MSDDPFDEFSQVLETTAAPEEALLAEREKPAKTLPSFLLSSDDASDKNVQNRLKHEARVMEKLAEIHNVMGKLYAARHQSTDPNVVIQSTKDLLSDLNRLNEEFSILREKQMQKFSDSLQLSDLGISKRVNTRSFRNVSSVSMQDGHTIKETSKAGQKTVSFRTDTAVSSVPVQESSKSFRVASSKPAPSTSLKPSFSEYLPRTKSANNATVVAAMKQWNFEKEPTELEKSLGLGDKQLLLEEQVNELRRTIYKITQQKVQSPDDLALLEVLRAKLGALQSVEAQQRKVQQ